MTHLKRAAVLELSVKDLLSAGIGGAEPPRPVDELHASQLTKGDPGFCPREIVLMRMLRVERPPEIVQHAMRVTWDDGHDKQWRINNVYLRDHMLGDWRCVKCGEQAVWTMYPQHHDEPCYLGEHVWHYQEPEFRHPTGFTGSLDGIVQFSESRRRMLEIKIIKGEGKGSAPTFKELLAPLAEHKTRTQLYLRMLAETKDKRTRTLDTSAAHVLYVCRGFGFKGDDGQISPFKEFIVKRNDAAVERYVRMAAAVQSGGVPTGICPSAMCSRASKCPVAKECFSGKYKATLEWGGA